MNNFKRLGNSTLNELVNENVILLFLKKNLQTIFLDAFFFIKVL